MQYDAGKGRLALHYLLLATRLARGAGETGRATNSAGMLAYITAHTGAAGEAVQLSAAAAGAATGNAMLQARIQGRSATAHAAAGNVTEFRHAAEQAQDLLSRARRDETLPYLYYLNADQLDAEAGQGLLTLACQAQTFQKRLLNEAVDLLTPLCSVDARVDYQRSALLHGCYLAEAHLRRRDLEAAVDVTRVALTRLSDVQSRRCTVLLARLRRAFARRSRSPVVAAFLPEFDEALRN